MSGTTTTSSVIYPQQPQQQQQQEQEQQQQQQQSSSSSTMDGAYVSNCGMSGNKLKDDEISIKMSTGQCTPVSSASSNGMLNTDGMARLRQLYPFADVAELPLAWSSKDKANYISLSENNLKVHYKGNGKGHKDAASVRATHSVPQSCLLYYYEMKVVSKGRDGYMGIGLAAQNVNMQRLPGWDKQSYGYHGDDGHSFNSSGTGQPYGPTFTTNDVIGCGYNLVENTCFYTKNGLNLGLAFTELPALPYYPTVGLQTPGEEVEANFGMEPFVYDIEHDIAALRQRITSSIMNFPVKYTEWQLTMNRLVQSWLVHNGYCATAEVFSNSCKLPFKENVQAIKHRLKIQQLVLAGKIAEAIQLTKRLYPEVLEDNPNLLFALKCRQFVEMINGSDNFTEKLSGRSVSLNGDCVNGANNNNNNNNNNNKNINSSSMDVISGDDVKMDSAAVVCSNGECNGVTVIPADDNMDVDNDDSKYYDGANGTSAISENGENASQVTSNGSLSNHCQNSATTTTTTMNTSSSDNGGSSGTKSNYEDNQSTKLPAILAFGKELHALSQQLKKEHGTNERNKKMLRDAFSLLAYSNPLNSPVGWQLNPAEREPVCLQLNNAIVLKQVDGCCHRPPLETILQHTKSILRLNGHFGAWLIDKL